MTVLLDPAGTSRRSLDGVYALCVADAVNAVTARWMLSQPDGASYWAVDGTVADWEVVYKPPIPVGKLYYRTETDGGFTVVLQTRKGQLWLGPSGHSYICTNDDEPCDDEDGAWTCVQLGGADGAITDSRRD